MPKRQQKREKNIKDSATAFAISELLADCIFVRYLLSALHSLRARKLAVLIINNNKGTLIKETNLTREEERLLKNSPGDEALDKDLDEKYKNEAPPVDDKAAADTKVEEIKDNKK